MEPALRVYVGHANPTGDIWLLGLDPASATLAPLDIVSSGSSSSFLAFDPTRRHLYSTQNRSDQLSAFAVDPTSGRLALINRVPAPPGPDARESGPSYLSVDHDLLGLQDLRDGHDADADDVHAGGFVLCANYRGHNITVFRRTPGGALSTVVQNLSAGKHAHSVVFSPDGRHVFAPHLGSDLIAQYRFDPRGGPLLPGDPPAMHTPAGSGPRHLSFHPDGRHAYLVNELDATVMVLAYDAAAGTLTAQQRVDSLPAGYQGRRWAADIHVHPSGRFVYASNRAHDSLAIFAIDPGNGDVTLVGHQAAEGKTPRNFCLDAEGRFLVVAHEDSGSVAVFSVDQETGGLTLRSRQPVAPQPTFVTIVASP